MCYLIVFFPCLMLVCALLHVRFHNAFIRIRDFVKTALPRHVTNTFVFSQQKKSFATCATRHNYFPFYLTTGKTSATALKGTSRSVTVF